MFKRFIRIIPKHYFFVGAFFSFKSYQSKKIYANENIDVQKKEKIQPLKNLQKIELCQAQDIQENKAYEFLIGDYKVIVTKINGKLSCVGGTCTYDDKTQLKDGELFNNKIYCPQHGCAYNVQLGTVELAPAIDNLPMFYVKEENEKIVIYFPKNPPIKMEQFTDLRDYNDQRKVVIVGNGVAAFQAIYTLRSHGYTGEITMISKDVKLPYDKSQLTKQIKNIKYEDLLFKPDEWYDRLDIDYQLGQEVVQVYNEHGAPYLQLQDGTKIDYDALLFCTGEHEIIRNIRGIAQKSNVLFLRTIQDSKLLQSFLNNSQNLTVLGLSLKSLETISTLKKEYPDLNINLIDENQKTFLQMQLGDQVAKHLVNLHRQNGVNFHFHNQIRQMFGNEKVEKIELNTGEIIQSDIVLCFPNNKVANTEFLMESEKLDNLEFDQINRVKIDVFQRSEHKRLFFAGNCAAQNYFGLDLERIGCQNLQYEQHQGLIAGYNILGLAIPFHFVPLSYYNMYNKTFYQLGVVPQFDEYHISGSLQDNDFMVYYGYNNHILGVFGTRKREIMILNEAFRLQELCNLEQVKDGEYTVDKMKEHILFLNRSGCFRDLINKVKYDPIEQDILWINRDPKSQFWDSFGEDQRPRNYSDELNQQQ